MKISKMKRGLLLCICAVAVIAVSACSSMMNPQPYPRLNGSKVKCSDMASPENSSLIFGNVAVITENESSRVYILQFAQINPDLDPMVLRPAQLGTFIYFQPVPVGSCLHLVYWVVGLTALQGLQSGSDLTFTAEKPGLCYVGGYNLIRKMSYEGNIYRLKSWKFKHDTKNYELAALQEISLQFKGTAWEPVIASRIKELSNAK